jgi:hypothetical protein
MAFGIKTTSDGSGDFLPIVKFDARAGRFFRVDRVQGSNGWESHDEDITGKGPFIIDLARVQVGWISFANGPTFQLVPLGQPLPAKPGGVDEKGKSTFKQGFRVRLFAPQLLGGVREFSHTAKCVIAAMDQLHDAYLAAPESKEGKLPLVEMTGTIAVKTPTPQGTTTNYAPVFKIAQWLDRPVELDDAPAQENVAPAAAKATLAHPQSNHAQHVPPPAAAATAAPATPQQASNAPVF